LPGGAERAWAEADDGGEVANELNGSKGDEGELDALGCEVGEFQGCAEGVKAAVELSDGSTAHRSGCIEDKHAGAARLWVIGELDIAERDLVECVHGLETFGDAWGVGHDIPAMGVGMVMFTNSV